MNHRKEIDGLRAIALLPVILFHAGWQRFSGGFAGVDVFFVISGYLIASIILAQKRAGTFTLLSFYERRARRILPALILVMVACVPFAWLWMFPVDLKLFAKSVVAVSLFASNILFWKESGYFQIRTDLKPLLHTWSLGVEEQYYLLFPLFVLATWRFGERWIAGALGALAAASFSLAQWASSHRPEANFYLLPSRGWEILTGCLIAFYLLDKSAPRSAGRLPSQLLSFAGLLLIAYAVLEFQKTTPFPSAYTLVPVLGAACIILFASPQTYVGKLLGSKPLAGLGAISYSAYLWHQPLFAFARLRSLEDPGPLFLTALGGVSIGLAYPTWRFIENPFRDRQRVSRTAVFRFAAVACSVLVVAGCVGYLREGFVERFRPDALRFLSFKPFDCEATLAMVQKGKVCLIGDPQATPAIALVGDSHSGQLVRAFSESLQAKRRSALAMWHPACVPLIDVATKTNPECSAFITSAYEVLTKRRPISTVVLAADWSFYTSGHTLVDFTSVLYSDPQSVKQDRAENAEVFKRGLARSEKILKDARKRVILVKTIPEYRLELERYWAHRAQLGLEPRLEKDQLVTRDSYCQRNSDVQRAFDDLELERWAKVVDPFQILCGSGSCQYVDENGNSLYSNANHLSYFGARLIVAQLMKDLD